MKKQASGQALPSSGQADLEKEFWLFWGIAPEGSLKHRKGKDTLKFIKFKLAQVEKDSFEKGFEKAMTMEPKEDVLYKIYLKGVKETISKIDPFDLVEDCNPDCTPEEHAYHEGTWKAHLKLQDILDKLESELTSLEKENI